MPRGFQPLSGQDDDYRLNDLSSPPPLPPRSAQQGGPTPSRWQSVKSSYRPQVTYVASNDQSIPKSGVDDDRSARRKSSRFSLLANNPVSDLRIPKFAAPWQHEIPLKVHGTNSRTVRYFDRSKQWKRVFINGFLQWLVTLVIVLCMLAVLYGFSRDSTITRTEKYWFNAIITLLSLALGLAVVSALKAYCKLLSWRFLASQYRDLQDFELVMNCDSQAKVLKLLWAGRTAGRFWWLNKTQLLCLVSLFVFVALQLTIGLLGLTYSIDTSEAVDHIEGKVSIVDLSNIYQDSNYNVTNFVDQTAAANYFGVVGQNYYVYDEALGQGNQGFESVYSTDNGTSFFYNYVDLSAEATAQTPVYDTSKRWVSTNASCVELKIYQGGYVPSDGSDDTLVYTDEQGQNRTIIVSGQTTLTSTYIGDSSPAACGPRCSHILILDTASFDNDTTSTVTPHLFGCNSTVSEVHNSDLCPTVGDCTLIDEYAKILAGAIGWSGTWYSDGSTLQFQNYPPGSPYSWDSYDSYLDPVNCESLLAGFAIQAVAAMDDAGPRITVRGSTPTPGLQLTVEWKYSIPLLAVVPLVQFAILLIVCVWSNGALIKDGSYLAAARLLRPVVDKLEEHGCALTGDEIARELGNFKIIYGAKAPAGTRHSIAYSPDTGSTVDWHVGVIAESEGYGKQAEEGWRPKATFPGGFYDGIGLVNEQESDSLEVCEGDQESLRDEKAGLLSTYY